MSKIRDALQRAKQEFDRQSGLPLFRDSVAASEPKSQTRVVDYAEDAVIKNKIITPYFDNHAVIEQFKLLRTKILQETQEHDYRTILITSSLPQEGKTFIAVNLAITSPKGNTICITGGSYINISGSNPVVFIN